MPDTIYFCLAPASCASWVNSYYLVPRVTAPIVSSSVTGRYRPNNRSPVTQVFIGTLHKKFTFKFKVNACHLPSLTPGLPFGGMQIVDNQLQSPIFKYEPSEVVVLI
jgi:hypothetical protein